MPSEAQRLAGWLTGWLDQLKLRYVLRRVMYVCVQLVYTPVKAADWQVTLTVLIPKAGVPAQRFLLFRYWQSVAFVAVLLFNVLHVVDI